MNGEENLGSGQLLELLELYINLVEKQDVTIRRMSNVIRRQEEELQRVRNIYGLEIQESPEMSDDRRNTDEALKDYERARKGL